MLWGRKPLVHRVNCKALVHKCDTHLQTALSCLSWVITTQAWLPTSTPTKAGSLLLSTPAICLLPALAHVFFQYLECSLHSSILVKCHHLLRISYPSRVLSHEHSTLSDLSSLKTPRPLSQSSPQPCFLGESQGESKAAQWLPAYPSESEGPRLEAPCLPSPGAPSWASHLQTDEIAIIAATNIYQVFIVTQAADIHWLIKTHKNPRKPALPSPL